jgi:transcriptional regulator with XRE-family HTH domain
MGKQYRDQRFIEKICVRIIEIRKEKGIVQEDLVDRTGFNLKQIGNIERGISNTSISNIAAIARALEVHPKELLDFDFEIPKNPPLRKNRKGKK